MSKNSIAEHSQLLSMSERKSWRFPCTVSSRWRAARWRPCPSSYSWLLQEPVMTSSTSPRGTLVGWNASFLVLFLPVSSLTFVVSLKLFTDVFLLAFFVVSCFNKSFFSNTFTKSKETTFSRALPLRPVLLACPMWSYCLKRTVKCSTVSCSPPLSVWHHWRCCWCSPCLCQLTADLLMAFYA